jgi:hypothetical protein
MVELATKIETGETTVDGMTGATTTVSEKGIENAMEETDGTVMAVKTGQVTASMQGEMMERVVHGQRMVRS